MPLWQKSVIININFHQKRTFQTSFVLLNKKSVSKKYSQTLFLPSSNFPVRLEGKKRVDRDKQIAEECRLFEQYTWQREHRQGIVLLDIFFCTFFPCIRSFFFKEANQVGLCEEIK